MSDKQSGDHSTPLTPAQDEIASYRQQQKQGRFSRFGDVPEAASSAGSSTAVKALLAFLLLALVVTAVWGVWTTRQLQQTNKTLGLYEARINDLERRLSFTDEDLSDSTTTMQVKLKELDTEIRKLWDNVWKRSKQRLAEHDAQLAKQQKFIDSAKKQLSDSAKLIADLNTELQSLQGVDKTLTELTAAQKKMLAQVQDSADKLNKLTAQMRENEKRVAASEEWIESINAFRRQVNRDINALRQSIAGAGSGG